MNGLAWTWDELARYAKRAKRDSRIAKPAVATRGGNRSRPSKYKNVRVELDGHVFASRKEARRYGQLKLLLAAGEITDLNLQVKIRCVVNSTKVCDYIADFAYYCRRRAQMVHEDVKGIRTPVFRLKKKLVLACTGIEITEV